MLFLMPQQSFAGWHSKADQLPGMTDSEMITYTLIIVGGLVLIYFATKSMSKPHKNETTPSDSTLNKNKIAFMGKKIKFDNCIFKKSNIFEQKSSLISVKRKLQVLPYLKLKNTPESIPVIRTKNALKEKTIIIGLALNF